jgi:predicted SprT family Zn-dependent metalloprotease
MNREQATELFKQELARFPHISHYGLEFIRTIRILGRHYPGVIQLSLPYIEVASDEDILDTIRHEIAHALAPRGSGHGRLWQLQCLVTGCRPERCGKEGVSTLIREKRARVFAKCADCGSEHGYLRIPKHIHHPKAEYTHTPCRFKQNKGLMIFLGRDKQPLDAAVNRRFAELTKDVSWNISVSTK